MMGEAVSTDQASFVTSVSFHLIHFVKGRIMSAFLIVHGKCSGSQI